MKILITGSEGFIGRNLRLHLSERKDVQTVLFDVEQNMSELDALLDGVDFIFHLAGINRPQDPNEFITGNAGLTSDLVAAVERTSRKITIAFTSSIQAALDNPYGASKRLGEQVLFDFAARNESKVIVFRLPNVFGKWCRPNYNSAVAMFCHNTARGVPIKINDPSSQLSLVYVDDVVAQFIRLMDGEGCEFDGDGFAVIQPVYSTTVGEVADLIESFKNSRDSLTTERVGAGLVRALYSTYVSYLPTETFSYTIPKHGDARGVFVEMLKTKDSGQFSYFTAHPGITRGGHYHHTKTEKFLVIKGEALFKFRHMQTGETYELTTRGESPEVVETIPGWAHDITNMGKEEMIVMLWANEVFDREKPDTCASPL
jgi:UDP-2-acetamido-2,6-beta-L-arabino-hexul-4-ose reductase